MSFGRPRRTSRLPRYKSASAIQASVISGASSVDGEARPDFLRFTFMTMPNADNSPCNATWSPNQYHDSIVQPAGRDVARLAIIEAVVNASQMSAGKNLSGSPHVEPALAKQHFSLLRVAGNAHVLIVATINPHVNSPAPLRLPSTFELSRPRRQVLLGRARIMSGATWSGQATPAVAGRLERGVRRHRAALAY